MWDVRGERVKQKSDIEEIKTFLLPKASLKEFIEQHASQKKDQVLGHTI